MNRLNVSVQTTALPVVGVTDRRFRHERSHSYIFLLTLISAISLYCLSQLQHSSSHPWISFTPFCADCHRPFRSVLKSSILLWCFSYCHPDDHIRSQSFHPSPHKLDTHLLRRQMRFVILDKNSSVVTPDPNHSGRVFLLTLPYPEFP